MECTCNPSLEDFIEAANRAKARVRDTIDLRHKEEEEEDDIQDSVKDKDANLITDSEWNAIFNDGDKQVKKYMTKRKRDETSSKISVPPPPPSLAQIGSGLGQVAVAKYVPGRPIPRMVGYQTILIHTSANGLGGCLSPYQLKNEFGHFLENIWQFSKLYERVGPQRTSKNRFHPDELIWEHPDELHMKRSEEDLVTEEYWNWRKKGMENFYPIRWPNGYHGAKLCVCAIVTEKWLKSPDSVDPSHESPFVRLSYVEARKKIYCAEYVRLCPKQADFQKMKSMVQKGRNILIAEIDGPPINQSYHGYPYNKVSRVSPGLVLDEQVIRFLVEDERFPFGHGYVIGALLKGGQDWLKGSKNPTS